MSGPKKLIRVFIVDKLKEGESEVIHDQKELNQLYALKIREELEEIQLSGHNDVSEFVDLIEVAYAFAKQNGFTYDQIAETLIAKRKKSGPFRRIALNNLNPNNPSNRIYFENNTTKEEE